MNWRVLFVAAMVAGLGGGAMAAPGEGRYSHRVSPKVQVWLNSPALRAHTLGVEGGGPAVAPVLIRFHGPPGQTTLRRLASRGVRFEPDTDRDGYLHLGPFYPASAGREGVRALARDASVRQVDLDAIITSTRPLDHTASEVKAPSVWPLQANGVPLTGKGMLLGNIDGGVSVAHPAFFRADGKLYNWLDTDGDGTFKPGTDAVDLDGDGKAGSGEKLHLLEGAIYDPYKGTTILNSKDGAYTPEQDWLFADTDGDGQRDQGASAGYTDTTPVLGEPLFVGEDLDGDGILDLEEKVRALKTNKVKAVRTGGKVYTRGKDLSQSTAANKGRWVYHGTATTGIVVGGQRGYLKRVGLAPDAEVLLGTGHTSGGGSTSLTADITWMAKTPVHVMLHEYSDWSGQHLDGSSNTEGLLDQATQLGIPQVVPAGNLGGSYKVLRSTALAWKTTSLIIKYPPALSGYTNYLMQFTLLWRNPKANLKVYVIDPSGNQQVNLTGSNTAGKTWGSTGVTYYDYRSDSSRGTAMIHAMFIGGSSTRPTQLTSGNWKVKVEHPGPGNAVNIYGYVSDAIGGWTQGVRFSTNFWEKGRPPTHARSRSTRC